MFEPQATVTQRYRCALSYPLAKHGSHYKMVQNVPEKCRVLDVGCASGYLSREFKMKGCYVVGIESDEEAAKCASQFCDKIIAGDVEDPATLSLLDGSFDRIVFGDVLEHLRRPDLVLRHVKQYLHPNGQVIASIPNIVCLPIRFMVLLGRFEYKDAGLLDKTHLRFFTLKTAKELFLEQGYRIVRIEYTELASLIKVWPELLATQFIMLADIPGRTFDSIADRQRMEVKR